MSRRIDSVTQSTGITTVRPSSRDGRALLAPRDPGDGEGGLRREPGWKVDVAGPFDPMAPRGTYLDILV